MQSHLPDSWWETDFDIRIGVYRIVGIPRTGTNGRIDWDGKIVLPSEEELIFHYRDGRFVGHGFSGRSALFGDFEMVIPSGCTIPQEERGIALRAINGWEQGAPGASSPSDESQN
jgi:hypothetical protein